MKHFLEVGGLIAVLGLTSCSKGLDVVTRPITWEDISANRDRWCEGKTGRLVELTAEGELSGEEHDDYRVWQLRNPQKGDETVFAYQQRNGGQYFSSSAPVRIYNVRGEAQYGYPFNLNAISLDPSEKNICYVLVNPFDITPGYMLTPTPAQVGRHTLRNPH